MRTRLIFILAAAAFSGSAIAADHAKTSAVPIPESCTVSSDATGARAVIPIANFGPDSRIEELSETADILQTVGSDGAVVNWSLRKGTGRYELYPAREGTIPALLGSSRDLKFQVWSDGVQKGEIWNNESGKKVAEFAFPAVGQDFRYYDLFGEVVFAPDNAHVAIRRGDGSILLFETGSGKTLTERTFPEEIRSLRFSDDGGRLFLRAADDGKTRWTGGLAELDARSGEVVLSNFGKGPMGELDWKINRDGTRLLEMNNLHSLINAQNGEVLVKFPSDTFEFSGARFTRDGKFVVATKGWTTRVIDSADGRVVGEFDDLSGEPPFILDFDVQFAPDNRSFIVRKDNGVASLVRVSDGKAIAALGQFKIETNFPLPEGDLIYVNEYPTGEFAFSIDGSRLVTRGDTNVVSIWDARSGRLIREIGAIGAGGRYMQSPSGAWLVTISEHGRADLWALNDGRRAATLGKTFGEVGVSFVSGDNRVAEGVDEYGEVGGFVIGKLPPYAKPRQVAPSPEDRVILSDEHASSLLSTRSGTLLAKLEKTYEQSIGVNWIFVGSRIYARKFAELEREDELWDVVRNKRITKVSSEDSTDFLPDGDRLWFMHASKADGLFELREISTGKQVLRCHDGIQGSFVQTSGSVRFFTTSKDKRATLWQVGPR